MGIRNMLARRRAFAEGVCHCTFNPDGPGVVRIHLVPPKFRLSGADAYIVILNGYYLLPIGYSWAVVLSSFMKEVNVFDGMPITDEDVEGIAERTVKAVRRVYPRAAEELIREDLEEILDVLFAVAQGQGADVDIEKLSIRAYGKKMTAPHRMDLMVSAMTDEKGCWQCNQKCRFCYAAGQSMSGVKELTTDQWLRVIDRLEEAHVPMVTFTGGEPTQRSDLVELVGHAKRMVTRLNTNGINLTQELVAGLKEAGLDSIQVTLYSHHREIHNALVGGDHFDQTVQGIRNAVAAGLDISINTPLCRKNRDYDRTLAFARELGVRFATVSGLICTGMAGINHEEYDLSEEELFAIVKAAKAYCEEWDMEMDFTSPGLIGKEKLESLGMNVPMCGACLSNMAIAPDGTVVPCQSWLGADSGLGSILEVPFQKIWKHPRCVTLRKMSEEAALACPFRAQKGGDRV